MQKQCCYELIFCDNKRQLLTYFLRNIILILFCTFPINYLQFVSKQVRRGRPGVFYYLHQFLPAPQLIKINDAFDEHLKSDCFEKLL